MKNSPSKPFGLPRKCILRGKTNFDRIFHQGITLRASAVDLKYFLIPKIDNPECLAAFITGRRLGKAVDRNTIRRRLREAYRLHSPSLRKACSEQGSGVHIALIAKRANASYSEIERDVVTLLTKVAAKLSEPSERQGL